MRTSRPIRSQLLGWQMLAGAFTLILFAFLVISLTLPWDTQIAEIEETKGEPNVDGKLVGEWTWRGLKMHIAPASDKSQLSKLSPDRKSRPFLMRWDDLPSSSNHARRVYILSMFFAIMTLLSSCVLFFVIMFAFIVRRTSVGCHDLFQGRPKWAALLVGGIVLIFSILGWGLFLQFPEALDNDGLCADLLFDVEDELWCESRSLVGSAAMNNIRFKLIWQNGTNTVPVDARFAWSPAIGWIFSCVSSGLTLFVMVLICLINPKREYPLGWEYRLLNEPDVMAVQ